MRALKWDHDTSCFRADEAVAVTLKDFSDAGSLQDDIYSSTTKSSMEQPPCCAVAMGLSSSLRRNPGK